MHKFKTEVEEITPGLAAKWLAATADSDVTHKTPGRASLGLTMGIAKRILSNDWVEDTGSPIIIGPKGEVIDGIHRLKAIIASLALHGDSIRAAVMRLHSLDDAQAALNDQLEQSRSKRGRA